MIFIINTSRFEFFNPEYWLAIPVVLFDKELRWGYTSKYCIHDYNVLKSMEQQLDNN